MNIQESSNDAAAPRTPAAAKVRRAFCGLLAAFLIQACSTGTTAARTDDCAPVPDDSAFRENGPVYRDCAVERAAKLTTPDARIGYRPSTPPRQGTTCYFAVVEFVVDARGVPEMATARIVRTNETPFGHAVVASLPGWRYEPAVIGGLPVRQVVTERRDLALAVVVTRPGDTSRPPRAPSCR